MPVLFRNVGIQTYIAQRENGNILIFFELDEGKVWAYFSNIQDKGLPFVTEIVQVSSSLHHSVQEPCSCRYTLTGLYFECSF